MSGVLTVEHRKVRELIGEACAGKKPKGFANCMSLISNPSGLVIGPTSGRMTISKAKGIVASHVFDELPMGVPAGATPKALAYVYSVRHEINTGEIFGASDESREESAFTEEQIARFVLKRQRYLATCPDSSTFFLNKVPFGRWALICVRKRDGIISAGTARLDDDYVWHPGHNLFVLLRPKGATAPMASVAGSSAN